MTEAEFIAEIQALEPERALSEILEEAFKDYKAKVRGFQPKEKPRRINFKGPGTYLGQMIQAYADNSEGMD
jgi:hypothetical protein